MFCVQCGHELVKKKIEERQRDVCPKCGWVYYQQLKVSAAVFVEENNKLLLLKRAYEPWKGYWYLPAGYVEHDEDPKIAGERETKEEIGIDVVVGDLASHYYFDDDPRGNGLLLVYKCQLLNNGYMPNDEILDFGLFSSDELPDNLCGAGHKRAIENWAKQKNEKNSY